jgi:SPP1 family predicted phage head-tail adaptor
MSQGISAGLFNRRISLYSPVASTWQVDTGPESVESDSWNFVRTVWAQIDPGSGNERRESDREINESPGMIYVRYLAGRDIKPNWRAKNIVSGDIYDIRDVSHIMEGRKLVQLVVRVVT